MNIDIESANPQSRLQTNSIAELFNWAVSYEPTRVAWADTDRKLSYKELNESVLEVAQSLDKLPLCNNKVALALSNSLDFLVVFFALISKGITPVLVNPKLPFNVQQSLLDLVEPSLIVSSPAQIKALRKSYIPLETDSTLLTQRVAQRGRVNNILTDSNIELGVILFSGGTTGVPKPVLLSEKALCESVRQMEWGWPTKLNSEKWLAIAPFTHIYGLLMGVLNPLYGVASTFIIQNFNVNTAVDIIRSEKISMFGGGPPSLYKMLLDSGDINKDLVKNIHTFPGGGSPFPMELHRSWKQATGMSIREGYGMTEIAPIAINNTNDEKSLGSVGLPVPGTSVSIHSMDKSRMILAANEVGEVVVTGPQIFSGYLNNNDSKECNNNLESKRQVKTGDIGYLCPKGYLYLMARQKDVLFVKGYNVFPKKIEDLVSENDYVRDVCVIGVPDNGAEERVVAIYSRHSDSLEVTINEQLTELCSSNLAHYEVPSEFLCVTDMPLTAAGKINKEMLKEYYFKQKTCN